jgi:hypothetical protein
MTTGPRNTPHPIILHVDAQGNPVRLAEASAIYATNVSAVTVVASTVSASQWLGLESVGGYPGGSTYEVQYKGQDGNFAAETAFRYDPIANLLIVPNAYVGNLSSTNLATLDEVRATSFSSIGLSSTSFNTNTVNSNNIYATTISATTVCATNYDAQFNALSFSNLDNRYLNSSGDSVTGSFVVQALSATTISATTYLNLPSSLAIWNASAIQGRAVNSTPPSLGESLVWLGSAWGPSAVAGVAGGSPADPNLSIQFKNGAFFSGTANVTYNQSISGIQSVGLSSTNLISRNISATVVSATSYLNLREGDPLWNANKIQNADVLKDEFIANGDILVYTVPGNNWETQTPSEYADYIYPVIQNRIPSAVAIWNASAIQGRAVTSTPPVANNVLIYNGSVWTPSSAISLGTIAATNLGGTDIVGTRANLTSISAITVSANSVIVNSLSSLNISSTSARITGLSATTISATNWLGLPSAVAIWNASAINGIQVLQPDNSVTGNDVGVLFYSRPNNLYYTLPFSSIALAGSRNIAVGPYQGQVVASYLGSASPEFQINPIWDTVGIKDLPENNDVLVYKSNLYNLGQGSAWTWAQPSSLVPAVTPFGSTGQIQFRGPDGNFSSIPGLLYGSDNNYLGAPNIYIPDGGTIDTPYIYSRGGGYIGAQINILYVSAGIYNIFGKDTSSAVTVTPPSNNNQNIVYDSAAQKWKPGYAIYQATSTPAPGFGSNGDVYFQYLP